MIKKIHLFIFTALSLLVGVAVQAADSGLPWPKQNVQPSSWQGFYFGVNAGYAWGHDNITQSAAGSGATGFNPEMDTEGGAEGFHAGYNYNTGTVVIGADADWDYSGADGGYRVIANGSGQDQKFEWLSSIRGRVGLPLGNFFPFITGGAAFSDIKDSYVNSAGFSENKASVRTAWVAGAGFEYAMPENFTFRADYRYYDFGSYSDTPASVFPGFSYKQEPHISTVTAGISYNFW